MSRANNTGRSKNALDAIHGYDGSTPGSRASKFRRDGATEGIERAIVDIVGDFHHLCDRLRLDADALVAEGQATYRRERITDPEGPWPVAAPPRRKRAAT